jgi:hypothetical protein
MIQMPFDDPRTVARDIPGVFDSIFPQLTPGVVAHFNRTAVAAPVERIASELIQRSRLQKAMLFELGVAVGEKLLSSKTIDWGEIVAVAVLRQRRHFDAEIPREISDIDRDIALRVGSNMASMISGLAKTHSGGCVVVAPPIPGFQWIASGTGDASVGNTLIEVKCSNRNFSASDYRQIVMYWLLSFAASIESGGEEWDEGVLLNPRSASYVIFKFGALLNVISAGLAKVEIIQLFASMIGTRNST